MAETATIARPYAEAVFGLADKAGALPAWSKTLARMAQVAAHAEVQACIGNPNLGADRLYGLFVSLCGDELPLEVQNFVRVLIANDRLALLPEIDVLYEELKNEREGVVEAQIQTAFPLDDAHLAGLVADLERRFKRKVQPQVSVDRELIGGVRIVVGDEVIDGSVRGKLADMAAALKS
ncbi:MAG: F0F1 ATP synthase subunit delta [Burkholderiales bacterium]